MRRSGLATGEQNGDAKKNSGISAGSAAVVSINRTAVPRPLCPLRQRPSVRQPWPLRTEQAAEVVPEAALVTTTDCRPSRRPVSTTCTSPFRNRSPPCPPTITGEFIVLYTSDSQPGGRDTLGGRQQFF